MYISLPLFCTTATRNFQKLLSYTFYFFSLPLTFTLHWWPLAFLILSPPLQNFHVVLPTKMCFRLIFISRSRSLSSFFSLSFAGLPLTFSFSLSFSCSTFQICGHDNYSKLNNLDNTDTQTISAFRFRLYWFIDSLVVSALQDAGSNAISRKKITLSCIWVAIPVDWVFFFTLVADGRSGGRTVTWLPKFLRWVDYTFSYPWCSAARASLLVSHLRLLDMRWL